MKTKTYTVYKFHELTKEQQDKAVENLYEINIDYMWYDGDDFHYPITLKAFNLDHQTIEFDFKDNDATATADYIIENHGDICDTYKTSAIFLKEHDALRKAGKKEESESDDAINDLEEQYKKDIGAEFLKLLKDEYNYRTTRDAIIETIEANDYNFTNDGNID